MDGGLLEAVGGVGGIEEKYGWWILLEAVWGRGREEGMLAPLKNYWEGGGLAPPCSYPYKWWICLYFLSADRKIREI